VNDHKAGLIGLVMASRNPEDKIHYHSTTIDQIRLIDADYRTFAFQRHYHLDIHIGLITRGQQQFFFKGSQHLAGKQQIIMMPPDEIHDGHTKRADGYSVNVFTIHPDWFRDYFHPGASSTLLSFRQLIIDDVDLFIQLQTMHQRFRQDKLSQLARDCLPYDGFSVLLERYGQLRDHRSIALGHHSINNVREYLLENLDQPIYLQTLANLCHLSPVQFQRHFKAKMGLTPYAWLVRLRLEKAMQLLQSGLKGTAVAHAVGFYDQAHFSKAFKRAYGISPSSVNQSAKS
jgi:AraC-like DNA-binding protein